MVRDGLPSSPGGVLIMAAGQSRRFGSQKLLHPLADGQPVILHTLRLARQLAWPVTLVVDRLQSDLRNLLEGASADVLDLSGADAGLGANLARAVAARSSWSGWLVMLGDMPFIAPATLCAVAGRATASNLVVPVHQERPGHPVWFGADFAQDLARLSGDQGGRAILNAHGDRLIRMAVDDSGIHRDIDTPADLPRRQPS